MDDGTALEPTIGAGNARKPKANTPADPKSFDEIMAEKQAKPAEAADPNLKTKTMTVKSGDEELEIKYSVHVPEGAKKRLEERKRAREEAKGSRAPEEKAPAAESAEQEPEPAEHRRPDSTMVMGSVIPIEPEPSTRVRGRNLRSPLNRTRSASSPTTRRRPSRAHVPSP